VKCIKNILTAILAGGTVTAVGPTITLADDPFTPKQILASTDDDFGFGASLATYGDYLIAGQHWDTAGGEKAGSVSLLQRVVSDADALRPWTWSPMATLLPTAEETWSHSWFGSALDMHGSTVVVGAPRWDLGVAPGDVPTELVDCGGAWIFDADAAANAQGTVLPVAQLTISGLQIRDYFGSAVAIDGDIAVVGAWGHDIDPLANDNTGAAFVFERQTDSTWLHTATLSPPTPQAGGRFGMAIAIDGDHIVVGAPWAFDYSGNVHTFDRVNGQWQWAQQINNPGTSHARFGSALALDARDGQGEGHGGVLIGAPGDSTAGPQAGHAWGFKGLESGGYQATPEYDILPSWAQAWDEIGASVELMDFDNQEDEGHTGSDGGVVLLIGAPSAANGAGRVDVMSISEGYPEWAGSFTPASGSVTRFGHAVSIDIAGLPEWGDQSLVRIFISAPGNGAVGLGEVEVFEFVSGAGDGDCDNDGVWDFLVFDEHDCDGDGWYDACQVAYGTGFDCDGNGVVDSCELNGSTDCDGNGVLDACEPDFDGDGTIDACDDDVDGDGYANTLDAFPWNAAEWFDTDNDGIGDNADDDDDGDGVQDGCDSDQTPGIDCDLNGVLDVCELHPAVDCNLNGVLDSCELNATTDCNDDGVLDSCQLNGQTDCNGNGTLDECETGWSDCDEDGITDLCQIQSNPSLDCNDDAVLDSCQEIASVGDPSWSTERYFGDFDLSGLSVLFDDSDSDLIYTTCTVDMQNNWIVDPSGGVLLPLGDDAFAPVPLPFPFTFKGVTYNTMEVGSNGYITFGGQGDASYTETLAAHFAMPRISAVFDDLDPSEHGEVRTGIDPQGDFIHVSWIDVAHYRSDSADPMQTSSFQIVLYADGAIDMCWRSSEVSSAIAGLSGGTGQPLGFAETDLSNATDCIFRVPTGYGDCDGDGVMDNCQIPLIGDPWWVTEQLIDSFDLSGWVAQLNPTGNSVPPAWSLCTDAAAQGVFIPPAGGIMLPAKDDDSTQVVFANVDGALANFVFDYAGTTFTDCWMSPNGHVTFASADNAYEVSLVKHFEFPRVSVLFHDLDPTEGGYMHVGAGPAGSFVATWHQIPNYENTSQISTVQIQLHPNGAITLVWLEVGTPSAIIGLSDGTGTGIPQGFAETDYSLAFDCQLRHALDDCNANGIYDSIEIALGCGQDDDFDGLLNECDDSDDSIGVWDPTACPGDVDGNQAVDVRDLIGLLQCWNVTQGACAAADLDGNDIVGPGDVLLMVQHLGTHCN
jgi:hypothetical protein